MQQWICTQPQRLYAFLTHCLPLRSQAVRQLVKDGNVRVNNQKIRENTELSLGDAVQVYLPKSLIPTASVVFLGDRFLVAEKQPAMEVTGDGLTLEALLRGQGYPTARALHRLDAWTGGLVLFALDDKAEEAGKALFKKQQISKGYQCIARGIPVPSQGTENAYLQKNAEQAKVRVSTKPMPGWLPIQTGYRVLSSQNGASLIEVQLYTGRTHQIRAHLAFLGHPLLGDDRYGIREWNKQNRVQHPCLWAVSLEIPADLPGIFNEITGKTFHSAPRFPRHIDIQPQVR